MGMVPVSRVAKNGAKIGLLEVRQGIDYSLKILV